MKYFISHRQFIKSATAGILTDNVLIDSVASKNDKWSLRNDEIEMAIIAECKNKPRDLLVYGLHWEVTEKE